MINVFLFIIFLSFILDSLGIKTGQNVSYFLTLFSIVFVYLFVFFKNKPIIYPKKFTLIFFLFLLFSAVSTILSVDIQKSTKELVSYISVFWMFIWVFNCQKEIQKPIIKFIYALSFIFSIYSLFLAQAKIPFLIPQSGANLVYPTYNAHNHLGDFLILSLIISTLFLFKNKNLIFNAVSLLILLPFYIFSYSRSAYLALIASLSLMGFYILKNTKYFSLIAKMWLLALLILSAFFLLITSYDFKDIKALSTINKVLVKNFQFKNKLLFSGREKYITDAFWGIKEKTFFGLGPGNYFYASLKNTDKTPYSWTDTSHNIFLDKFSENGLIAGTLFIILMMLVIIKAKKNLFFFLFLGLLLNFQTDYTYKINSFLLLFFIIAGLIYQEENQIILPKYFSLIPAILLGLLIQLMLLSNIFYKQQNYRLGGFFYPLNKETYRPLIGTEITKGNYRNVINYLNFYSNLFKGDPSVQEHIGDIYIQYNEKEKALWYFRKAYYWHPYQGRILFRKLYNLKKELYGEKQAKLFADSFLKKVAGIEVRDFSSSFLRAEAKMFCQEIYGEECPYKL